MSDYSTESMKPKEFPDNCGNCEHVCYGIFDVVCPYPRYEGQEPYEHGHYRQCSLSNPCERYTARQGTLEQRYQQLEQVAKEMYRAIHRPYTLSDTKVYEKMSFRKQLEALGVSLDD